MYTSAIFGALLTAAQACSQAPNSSTKYLITFGDSYSQTGFDIAGAAPSSSNPLGNPNLPGWTSSGGVNWVSSLISELNTSLVLSYNFAYGGATVDSDLIAPYDPSVKSLIDQVSEFSGSIASGNGKVWNEEDALFGVWMGVNDVGNTFWLDDVESILGNSVERYFEQMQILYDAGARQFVVLTVPPTDKTPLFLGNDDWSRERLQSAITLFNDLVARGIIAFQESNQGITVKTVDTSVPFNAAISDPEEYGASDATCLNEDGVSCLWFNDYHPATAIQRLVAREVASSWAAFFSPSFFHA